MAHGLEIRVPFLDPVVAELAHALPLRRPRARARRPSACCARPPRRCCRRPSPAAPKRGFCTPVAAWLRGPLEELARDLLSPAARARARAGSPPRRSRALLDRARRAAARTSGRPLWALIAFGLWHDAVGGGAGRRPRRAGPGAAAGGGVMPSGSASSVPPTMRRVALAAVTAAAGAGLGGARPGAGSRGPGRGAEALAGQRGLGQLPLAAVRRVAPVRADRADARRRLPLGAATSTRSPSWPRSAAGSRARWPRRSSRRAAGRSARRSCASSPTAPSARSRRATSASTSSSTRCTRPPSPSARSAIFGTRDRQEFLQLRRAELSPLQICELNGRTRVEAQRGVSDALREAAAQGVRDGSLPPRPGAR